MNSSIPFRRFEKEYEASKKYNIRTERCNKNTKYFSLKFFDICFIHNKNIGLEDIFHVYL